MFLNVPYDRAFESLYLAYIARLIAFGLEPRATLQIPGGERRLDRILDLIRDCRYSFHDLSGVELNPKPPRDSSLQHAFRTGLGSRMAAVQKAISCLVRF
ncbi:MAG TPA: hypothetical protein VN924_10940 [Bryobacteraceae bacterium]|nr:hypothetical protein [Bryobacteraceae bacterium]